MPAVLSIVESQSVQVRNQGRLAHTWTVVAVPVTAEIDIAGSSVLAEGRVEVGQSVSVDISGLLPGSYQVVCAIPGHFTLGMAGQLEISGP